MQQIELSELSAKSNAKGKYLKYQIPSHLFTLISFKISLIPRYTVFRDRFIFKNSSILSGKISFATANDTNKLLYTNSPSESVSFLL